MKVRPASPPAAFALPVESSSQKNLAFLPDKTYNTNTPFLIELFWKIRTAGSS
jgi:hypothetical protein